MVSRGVIAMDRYRDLLFCECEIVNDVDQYADVVNNASSITVGPSPGIEIVKDQHFQLTSFKFTHMYKSPLETHEVNIISVTNYYRLKRTQIVMLQTELITRLKFSQQIPLYGKPLVYRSKQYSHANCHGYMKAVA